MEDGAGQVSFMGHPILPLRLAAGALVDLTWLALVDLSLNLGRCFFVVVK